MWEKKHESDGTVQSDTLLGFMKEQPNSLDIGMHCRLNNQLPSLKLIASSPLKINLLGPKREGSFSNHPFSELLLFVSGGIRLDRFKSIMC